MLFQGVKPGGKNLMRKLRLVKMHLDLMPRDGDEFTVHALQKKATGPPTFSKHGSETCLKSIALDELHLDCDFSFTVGQVLNGFVQCVS